MGNLNNLAQYKFPIDNKEAFTKKARENGIEFTNPTRHEYTYFKLPNEGDTFSVLRIKVSDTNKSVDMKIRNEETSEWEHYESKIEKPEELQKILEGIGCKPIVTFHKERTSYVQEDYRMDLDDLEEIGLHLEFKFPLARKAEMMQLLSKLDLKEEDKDSRSIVEIYLANKS